MKFSKKFFSRHVFLFALLLGITSAIGMSVLATTVGNNVSVSGTLSSSGNASFSGTVTVDGNSTFGNAATDVNLFTGTVQASTTALFTSGLTAYGDINVNGYATTTSSNGNFSTNGTLGVGSSTPSTTLGVVGSGYFTLGLGVGRATTTAGALEITGNVLLGDSASNIIGVRAGEISLQNSATTTIIAGNVNAWSIATSSGSNSSPFVRFDTANTRIGVATATPANTFSIGGAGTLMVGASSTGATSTITVDAAGSSRGSCINLRATDGNMVRIYATTTPATSAYVNNGTGLGFQNLVVERGSCR